ncbi:Bys1 family protein [Paracoccidioides lutzii Pb01]|uniref:Bys1 family protein n=1 Tax=Paracoccidioides lutzii (strain ATCC MYA-826 / Pb01) TaxID=502779 RepID=C1HBN4_PARBA|nr:Bys1 family protein [Paracoccidioides lutzii Pb01]EEH38448.1 Bys1 family protein [Paracoccidioides lutzii Pb01]
MRFFPLLLGALAALTPAAQAVGNAIVINKCTFPAFLNSVGSQIGPEKYLAPNGGRYSEPFRRDPQSGGIALKITRESGGLVKGAPQTIYAYNLNNNLIWYDLSNVFGNPFEPKALRLSPLDNRCPTIFWPNGVPPAGSQTRNCQPNSDVTLTLCA